MGGKNCRSGEKMKSLLKPKLFRHVINLWPPYLGAGIHITHISADWRKVVVQLRMNLLNRNYMGTHFGGSLFAMTDPFYMLMLIHLLGKSYSVWDKTASIEFIKPVSDKVTATFVIDDARLNQIRLTAADGEKHYEDFSVNVVRKNGEVVARINKSIYIRKKDPV
jgi:acyl-coenzyme A thioesterase PaaI-like protein